MNPMRMVVVAALLSMGCGSKSQPPTGGGGAGGTGGGGGGSWLTGASATLLSTRDGDRFVARSAPTTDDLYSLVCVGHQDGWAAGAHGTLIGTHDGGATWSVEASGVTTS